VSALRVRPGARTETALCRLAQDVAGLSGWRRYGLAFGLGALLAGALPPFDLTPLIFIAFPGLLWLDEGSAGPGESAWLGYVFGLGFFVAGLYWIAAALFVDIARFWWALPFAVIGLPALLALFPAAALGLTSLGTIHLRLPAGARVCLFAVAWSAAEWAAMPGRAAMAGQAAGRSRWRCCKASHGSGFTASALSRCSPPRCRRCWGSPPSCR
jgi:apolipoprotein N-acyltransferase